MALDDFADLLQRARGGDEAAFSRLFAELQPLVLRYLGSLAPAEMVDDIASETWMSVIRGLDSFRDQELANFQAWVLTLARRRWIDEVRRRSRRHEVSELSLEPVDRPDAVNVEAEIEQRFSAAAAVALVRRLPPDQAEVVLLRAISGLDVDQVATIVGKTPGAVRVLSHRGLRKLAKLLGDVTESELPSIGEMR